MSTPRSLLRLTCLLAAAACADRAPSDARVDLTTVLDRAEGLGAPAVRTALGGLGIPISTDARAVPNRYDPMQTDSVRTLRAEGLTVELYWVASSGQELVQSIVVADARFEAGLGFRVGAPRSAVLAARGGPGRDEDGVWAWDLYSGPDDPTPTALLVTFDADDRVNRIRFDYYLE